MIEELFSHPRKNYVSPTLEEMKETDYYNWVSQKEIPSFQEIKEVLDKASEVIRKYRSDYYKETGLWYFAFTCDKLIGQLCEASEKLETMFESALFYTELYQKEHISLVVYDVLIFQIMIQYEPIDLVEEVRELLEG